MSETWIVLGATSSMARAFSRLAAEKGHDLILAGRDMDDLERQAGDLALRHDINAVAMRFDARDAETFGPIIDVTFLGNLTNIPLTSHPWANFTF